MANLNTLAWTKLSTTTGVDVKTAASTTLYTPTVGKTGVVIAVVIRGNSASLAGGTDYDFTGWRQTVDLSGLTVTNGFRVLYATDNSTYTPVTTAAPFQITVSTGATAAGTATFDVFGYEY